MKKIITEVKAEEMSINDLCLLKNPQGIFFTIEGLQYIVIREGSGLYNAVNIETGEKKWEGPQYLKRMLIDSCFIKNIFQYVNRVELSKLINRFK